MRHRSDRVLMQHTFLSVPLDSETANIANGISRSAATQNCRETNKDGSLPRGISEEAGLGDIGSRFVDSEGSMSASATSMDNSFGNTLVVKSVNLQ